jgi:DNA polymerase I-like protein with 3'-5' exonuclease and polymerase domains
MKRTRIGYDMSAFLWNALLYGKDVENGHQAIHKEKPCWINSWHHGYDNVVPRMAELLTKYRLNPIDMILVFEGKNSKSKRLMIDKNYKQGREHPEDAYVEFLTLRDKVKALWLSLGAQVLTQDYAEGDDTLAWLAENTEDDLIIATFDNDLSALNGVNGYGATTTVWVNDLEAHNKYGIFDYHLITTYKALVGDSSDNIKGCVGFGPKTFLKFCDQYGYDGLQELHNLLSMSDLSPLAEMAASGKHPLVAMIVDQGPDVIRCFDLAKLRPEWVNTMAYPLTWEAGMVTPLSAASDPLMKKYYGRARLVSAGSFAAAIEWAKPLILASRDVALDIETTTSEESSEWLERKGNIDGVDVFGSTLCGLGLTFGPNNQYTLYFSVNHADTDNIASEDLRQFIAWIPQDKHLVIQNTNFELPVLYQAWGDKQLDNGFYGYLPNVLDTKLEASYQDENSPLGLKQRSLKILNYKQQTYEETTRLTGTPSELFKGGRLVSTQYKKQMVGTGKFELVPLLDDSGVPMLDEDGAQVLQQGGEIMKEELVLVPSGRTMTAVVDLKTGKRLHYIYADQDEIDSSEEYDPSDTAPEMVPVVDTETRQYKMHELPAAHVFGYGADDPICTIALHNFYKLFMQLEHTYETYLKVEIQAAYANAMAFVSGIPFSMERMMSCEREDNASVAKSWPVLRSFLIDKGWAGTVPPVYTVDITAAQVKEAFEIVAGRKLETMMRTVSKLAIFAREDGEPIFAELLSRVDKEKTPEAVQAFNAYVLGRFKGEPEFNADSPVQMKRLLYETLGLPVRLTNKVTDAQRAKGETQGTAKTDDLALQTALHYDSEFTDLSVLKAIQVMKQCGTRSKLYYKPYRNFPHWRDGLLHPSTNQCATVTRRNSASDPNYTQWPAKGEGLRFRECIVARKRGRVIISSDCSGQELRLAADFSRDPNMLSCYIGENLRDIHSMVAAAATKYFWDREWSYEEFYAALKGLDEELAEKVDALRSKSKAVTFGEIYGSMAKSLSERLMISEEEAQLFLDAKKAQFPGVDIWKDEVVAFARRHGYSLTMMGGRRHMREVLQGGDKWEINRAERQLSNFCIQSSGAEAIKIALGKCAFSEVMHRCDVHIIGSLHDELIVDAPQEHAYEVATEMVKFLQAPYGNMIVPFISETTLGLDFGHQLKLPLGFTPEQVQAVLEKMNREADERKNPAAKLVLKEAA